MSPVQFLFMGTGTSTGLPLAPCLTNAFPYPKPFAAALPLPPPPADGSPPPKGHYDPNGPWPRDVTCACCRSTVDPEVPEGWKNRRGNTGGVLRKKDAQGQWKNVLLDVGKTFREQAIRFFPRWGVHSIDAVVLTHGRESCAVARRVFALQHDFGSRKAEMAAWVVNPWADGVSRCRCVLWAGRSA